MKLRGSIYLLITSIIWGSAFVAQAVGNQAMSPTLFHSFRSFIASIALFVVYKSFKSVRKYSKKKSILTGIICGLVLAIASNLQQIGLVYSDVNKSGFITSLYIIMVPILFVIFKKRIEIKIWLSMIIAIIGLYFLTMTTSLNLELGDTLILASAFFFAVQIVIISFLIEDCNPILISLVQCLVIAIISLIYSFIIKDVIIYDLTASILPLLFTGILSSGVAYTLQIFGQRSVEASTASLILSLESVFAALTSMLLLNQFMTSREIFGSFLIFSAIIISQINFSPKNIK